MSLAAEQARHRIELAQFQGLVPLQGGQEAAQAPGQHGFAAARGADQQQVVAAGRGDFEGTAAMGLAPHIGQVQVLGGLLGGHGAR